MVFITHAPYSIKLAMIGAFSLVIGLALAIFNNAFNYPQLALDAGSFLVVAGIIELISSRVAFKRQPNSALDAVVTVLALATLGILALAHYGPWTYSPLGLKPGVWGSQTDDVVILIALIIIGLSLLLYGFTHQKKKS